MFPLLLFALAVQPPAAEVRPVARGAISRIVEPQQVTVADQSAWATLWARHAPGRERPAVDFSREIVIAIFMGQRTTAGYAVDVVGVREEGGATVVDYKESAPPRDAITAQVMTSPFVMVAIRKPAGAIRFEKR